MRRKATITVNRPRDEVQRLWSDSRHAAAVEGEVTFHDAPGDRGTEIHVVPERPGPGGKVGDVFEKLTTTAPLAKVKDELRHFKQETETGEVPRSDATPEGESFARKFKQRPAQPLSESEREKAEVR
jgi:uncharacterized membrane protein